jgi:8-oxo-dGTP pyrophosphatase MutT (NUDIX family)
VSRSPGPPPGFEPRPEWLDPLVRASRAVRADQLAHSHPPDPGARHSAVLIAVRDGAAGPAVLLIERAAAMRNHAGQVAFPGGGEEPGDVDAAATALREAHEEVGLDPTSVHVEAALPQLFLRPSGFLVTPVLAWWARPHAVHAVEVTEVARVAVMPLADLADPANRFRVRHPSGIAGPGFAADGLFIWGFTAALLASLLRLGGWERPWDERKFRPLPS